MSELFKLLGIGAFVLGSISAYFIIPQVNLQPPRLEEDLTKTVPVLRGKITAVSPEFKTFLLELPSRYTTGAHEIFEIVYSQQTLFARGKLTPEETLGKDVIVYMSINAGEMLHAVEVGVPQQ